MRSALKLPRRSDHRLGAASVALVAVVTSGCGEHQDVGQPLPLVGAPVAVVTHASQAHVVDLLVPVSGAAQLWVDLDDPMAQAESVEANAAGTVRVRLRALLADRNYDCKLTVRANGAEEVVPISFRTLPAQKTELSQFDVTNTDGAPDYRLFDFSATPGVNHGAIYLIDVEGRTRFFATKPAAGKLAGPFRVPSGLKLLGDGRLVFVQDGDLHFVDDLGATVETVLAKDVGNPGFHHDVIELPSGNLLTLGLEFGTFRLDQDGQDYSYAGDTITELSPGGDKVWEWSSFAHLDTQRVLEDFFVNEYVNPATQEPARDWTHANGVIHSPEDDSLLLSLRHQDWILKIDRSSGQVLWRLGQDGDFALSSGSWFFHQHSPQWQPDGSLLVYDNGIDNPNLPADEERSRPVIYVLNEKDQTAQQVWADTEKKYMSAIMGDADRTSTGTILVLDSSLLLDPSKPYVLDTFSEMREVDRKTGEWVWALRTPDHSFAYRAVPVTRVPGQAALVGE